MKNMLEYKGYHAAVEFDAEDMIFVGSVFGINDSLHFHASSVDELKEMFKQCIDNYLIRCEELGKSPDKEYKGSFNIRIDPDMHRNLSLSAAKNKRTLNEEIKIAIADYLNDMPRTLVVVNPVLNAESTKGYMNYSSSDTPAYRVAMGGMS